MFVSAALGKPGMVSWSGTVAKNLSREKLRASTEPPSGIADGVWQNTEDSITLNPQRNFSGSLNSSWSRTNIGLHICHSSSSARLTEVDTVPLDQSLTDLLDEYGHIPLSHPFL